MIPELKIKAQDVKGFNYHPSYSTGCLEDWIMFDFETWKRELSNGKKLFPKMNAVRIWLSWNAYCRLEEKFVFGVRQIVDFCKSLGIYVIPCLFNRWHDPMVDCDGIYIDHFLPGSSWLLKYGNLFDDYIDALCKEFKDEEGILVWDLCNEPFAYSSDFPLKDEVMPHELNWLSSISRRMRKNCVTQPLGIGSTGNEPMAVFGDICDVYLTHMYYTGTDIIESFEKIVERFANEAKENGKPLISSECCWGSFDDEKRTELIKVTLDTFKKYNVGYVVHALQYAPCADLHDKDDGRTSPEIGNLCFVKKDGSIRPGHDIFNLY